MKSLSFLMLWLCLTLNCSAGSPTSLQATVTGDSVNIRREPSISSGVITTVDCGAPLLLDLVQGDWCKVRPMRAEIAASALDGDGRVLAEQAQLSAFGDVQWGKVQRGDTLLVYSTFDDVSHVQCPSRLSGWVHKSFIKTKVRPIKDSYFVKTSVLSTSDLEKLGPMASGGLQYLVVPTQLPSGFSGGVIEAEPKGFGGPSYAFEWKKGKKYINLSLLSGGLGGPGAVKPFTVETLVLGNVTLASSAPGHLLIEDARWLANASLPKFEKGRSPTIDLNPIAVLIKCSDDISVADLKIFLQSIRLQKLL